MSHLLPRTPFAQLWRSHSTFMVLHRRSSEASSAGSVLTLACNPPMQVTTCTEQQLLGRALGMCVIEPTGTENDPELRYRCPLPGCPYIGAKHSHAGECLKHMLEPRVAVAEHHRFLVDRLICFYNSEGRPALHSKTVVPSAFCFRPKKDPSLRALAYMKVGHA